MIASESTNFFDAIASRYDRAYAPSREMSQARMARILSELKGVGERLRILDLGVGTGRELSALQDASHEIVGVDCSERMLAACRRRTRPITLVQADFWNELSKVGAGFDAALALHGTLAHAPDAEAYERLIRSLEAVLRNTGAFIAEVPSPRWLERVGPVGARIEHDEGAIRRLSQNECEYEDRPTKARIRASFLDAARWRRIFEPRFTVKIDDLPGDEFLIVARLSRSG